MAETTVRARAGIGLTILFPFLFLFPLIDLFRFAYRDDTFSYIVVVPFYVVYKLLSDRERIAMRPDDRIVLGILLLVISIGSYAATRLLEFQDPVARYTSTGLGATLYIAGTIGIVFGDTVLRENAFPLSFLLFISPIPAPILDPIVEFLRMGSTAASDILFKLLGVPVLRDGYTFLLPGLTIEVAKECSGIRSSLSLFLVSIVAADLFLSTTWRKAVLVLSILPITIFKNAVRIVMLSLLGVYVDPNILSSVVHQRGGIPIFFLATVLLLAVLWFLRRGEGGRKAEGQGG